MAEIKYVPVEIDGTNIEDLPPANRVERLLQALDVFLDSNWQSSNVNDGFNEVFQAIQNIEVGETNFNQILTSLISGQVLIDFNGNVLSKGFI